MANQVPSQNIASTPGQPDKLRIDFIGMAFALAIGEVGLEIGKFYIDGIRLREHLYLVTHIFLVVYIIASSWVGWQLSESQGNKEKLRDPFSLSFFILLIDLLLVICYFIIVQSIGQHPEKPDSKNEIIWTGIIFAIYIVWDIFTKLIVENSSSGNAQFTKNVKKYFDRAYQAPICLVITYFIIWPMRFSNTPKEVMCIDVLLICNFVLFRGLKAFKNDWKKSPIYIFSPIIISILAFLIYKNII